MRSICKQTFTSSKLEFSTIEKNLFFIYQIIKLFCIQTKEKIQENILLLIYYYRNHQTLLRDQSKTITK